MDIIKKYIGKNFRELRDKLSLSQAIMANQIGVSVQTIYLWERGTACPPADKLNIIKSIYGVNINWLITGEGEMMSGELAGSGEFIQVPLYEGTVGAGPSGGIVTDVKLDKYPFKRAWVEKVAGTSSHRQADLVLIRVSGDSMCPTINAGELVLVDQWDMGRYNIQNGRIYLITEGDGLIHLKRLLLNRVDEKVRIVLVSDNPAYPPKEIEIPAGEGLSKYVLGRVRWAGREFE